MKLPVISFILTISAFFNVWSQAGTDPVGVTATVIDATNKEPIPKARLKFESLPYGSKIGVMTGDSIVFSMEDGSDYSIQVEAEGYNVHIETLKVRNATDGTITKVIELMPEGGDRIIRLDRLIFALGKAEITEASHEELDDLAAMLAGNREMAIQLEGHTDFRGSASQNMKLSERRVQAVKYYLIKKGIAKKRIKTKAFGGTQPLSRSNDNESRTANRRVEVRILSN